MKIKRIAILGGGTAGWLCANHIGHALSHHGDIQITVIESATIDSIGVGEGTVPYIQNSLKRFGISEAEFLVKCDATFKQGIKFVDWLNPDVHGANYYYHPFDEPFAQGYDITNYLLSKQIKFENVGIQARICELGLAPKRKSDTEYQGSLAYAYHFDAAKFAALLACNAKEKFSVKHQFATIVDATCDEHGNIVSLIDEQGEQLEFDFYLDCSGFRALLTDKALKIPFVDKSDELLVDTALVKQIPLEKDEQLPPYTTATAHKAGWIWDIPLTTRRGTGFVYASKYMSEDEAKASYADYLNIPVAELSVRKLDMKVGFREQCWHKNCVSFGLAQGFVEPLEATSILLTDFCGELLAKNFPKTIEESNAMSTYFNDVMRYVWERTTDFIKLHYCISDRIDSDFWQENRDMLASSAELKQRLDKFKFRVPTQSDFFSRFDLFDHKNFLYVLYGMEFKTELKELSDTEKQMSEQLLAQNTQMINSAKMQLLNHRQWLESLKTAYQKIHGE
ncbi:MULTISPECIES: tryptophan halogenase family protein [Pseudoalteromonas]|uniref:Tryptophan halogenase n=1 Tax=Pseudoalteromonas amylolytica TaxID=1859457 RepID=A0A1S1MRD4_9GAMM|nr:MULTISPECIES: tryptophan halogenase family protein [Pseudoalteromonas]OHU86586.1 tryptophan halogenase [Pseudoalteromonas sp. JW3]OHU88889.1 tryptophan halogenase [Pseudoalteromonas amylolytica]